ncbi:hypothetical protein GWK47_022736 [Chionoecetes opilio]|uniref:HAT C-terminal dimerisation domain-containing protein n=1 Tax=Chionoecetes opilio TaxID=41210 RepID=A0A8J5CDK1_CHIOP|nr:hypothetical protein GWK47_022736 [Chionoecetes opilio]
MGHQEKENKEETAVPETETTCGFPVSAEKRSVLQGCRATVERRFDVRVQLPRKGEAEEFGTITGAPEDVTYALAELKKLLFPEKQKAAAVPQDNKGSKGGKGREAKGASTKGSSKQKRKEKEQAHATVECGTESCKQCELDGDVDEELEKNLHSWTQLDVQDNVPLSPDMFPMEHRQIWVALFIRYNTPVPSSAAVERLFSMGSDIMRPKRSSLTAKNLEKLVFLKGNMNLLKGRWELEDSDEED